MVTLCCHESISSIAGDAYEMKPLLVAHSNLPSYNRSASLISKYINHLKGSVLLPPDAHRALGLTFHVADLYLPEIKALVSAET